MPTVRSGSYVRHRIELIGNSEQRKLESIDLPGIDPAEICWLLGWGFALTEYLIAPTPVSAPDRMRICSLGAVVNLVVVSTDHLLDSGSAIERPLTQADDSGSPLKQLELHYFRCLNAMKPGERLFRTITKLITVMYEAEIAMVSQNGPFSYKVWVRKCCLPLVLMALPAWALHLHESPDSSTRYIRWLYRVGRFLGAMDDIVDYLDDASALRPNYFNARDQTESVLSRIADWGIEVLNAWDSFVPKTSETELSRETFLYAIWGW